MPKKINLLYVITKLELGGAQRQLLELCRYLDKERFNVFLFTAADGVLLDDFLAINSLQIKRSAYLERRIDPFKDILSLAEIYFFIRAKDISVVHTHSSKAGILGRIAAWLARVRVVIHTVHGWPFNDFQGSLTSRIYILLERLCAGFSDKIITVSRADTLKGLRNGIGAEDKYSLIRYGIDIPAFRIKDSGIRRELGIDPADPLIGMIACFKPQKKPLDFIRAAGLVHRSHPRARFILTGDGILRPEIEALVDKMGLTGYVFLTGWRRDIPDIMAGLDIFALSSYWEGLPIVVLEALCAGRPVVATDTGGIGEVIREGENGFLVRPGDTTKMAAKISLLLDNSALRERLSLNAGQSLTQGFTTTDMCRNTLNLYSFLIKQAMI